MEDNLRAAPILNEEKYSYLIKTFCSTLLGGFKFSEEQSGREITFMMYIAQIIIYLFFPILCTVAGLLSTNKIKACIISTVICFLINLILQLVALYSQRQQQINKSYDKIQGIEDDNATKYMHLIKPKNSLDLIIAILATAGLAWTLTLQIFSLQNLELQNPNYNFLYLVFSIVTGILSFYSIVNESPPEPGCVVGDNSQVSLYSTQYMRPVYCILIVAIKFIINNDQYNYIFNVLFVILPFLCAFAFLSNAFVTFMYVVERWAYWGLGSNPGASDGRTVLQTLVQTIIVLIISGIAEKQFDNNDLQQQVKKTQIVVLLGGVFASLAAENFVCHFQLANLKYKMKVENINRFNWPYTVIIAVICIVIPLVQTPVEYVQFKSDYRKNSQVSSQLMIISFICYVIVYLFQQSQSAVIFGIFRSARREISLKYNKIACLILQILVIITISLTCSKCVLPGNGSFQENFLFCLLVFRAFRYCFSDLQQSCIILLEVFIIHSVFSTIENYIYYTPVLTVANDGAVKILKRLKIWIYSIYKMRNEKKQKINNTNLFIVLSFTVLLPMNLFSIIFTSLLDTPFVPLLGLPLYFFGFPRQKRLWPELTYVAQKTGESLIYKKFFENYSEQLQIQLNQFNFMFENGNFFLIRIEKYLATLNIVEKGKNYCIIQMRGLESQEMTSCHNHEAQVLDTMAENIFEKKEYNFDNVLVSITPIQQFQVLGYEENQIKFTGIIEQQDFGEGFRQIYLKMLTYFANKYFSNCENDLNILQHVSQNLESFINRGIAHQQFPCEFAQFIQFNCETRQVPEIVLKMLKQKQIDEIVLNNPLGSNRDEDLDFKKLQQNQNKNISQINPRPEITNIVISQQQQQQRQTYNQNLEQQQKQHLPQGFDMDFELSDLNSNKNEDPKKKIINLQEYNSNNNNKVGKNILGAQIINNGPAVLKSPQLQQQNLNEQNLNIEKTITNNNNNTQQDLLQQQKEKEKNQTKQQQNQSKEGLLDELDDLIDSIDQLGGQNIQDQQKLNKNNNKKTVQEVFDIKKNKNASQMNKINQREADELNNNSNLKINNNQSTLVQNLQQNTLTNNIDVFQNGSFMQQKKQNINTNLNNNNNNISIPPDLKDNQVKQNQLMEDLQESQPFQNSNLSELIQYENQTQNVKNLLKMNNLQNQEEQKTNNNMQNLFQSSSSKKKNVKNTEKNLEDELEDMLEDIESDMNIPPPPPKYGKKDEHTSNNDNKEMQQQQQQIESQEQNDDDNNQDREYLQQQQKLRQQFLQQKQLQNKLNINVQEIQVQNNKQTNNNQMSGEVNKTFETPFMKKMKEVISLMYAVSMNDSNFKNKSIDKESLFKSFILGENLKKCKMFKKDDQYSKIYEIQMNAIRYAIKIAFDLYSINGTIQDLSDEEIMEEVKENEKNSYIGVGSDQGWIDACENDRETLWTLHYNNHDRTLSNFRSHYKPIKCTIFQFNEDIINGIWANLMFELYYVTNDDDERYSIQTHKSFLRNIIIESSENPLGYAPFYSAPTFISF